MISVASLGIILLLSISISLLIGWHARNWLGKPSPLEQSLRLELADLRKEMRNYEQEVNTHFKKTADLFNNLLKQSKNLYEHLLTSSKALCRSESEPESVMSFLATNKDNDHNWQEIVIKAPSSTSSPFSDEELARNSWHPTYIEVNEAKNITNNKLHGSDLDSESSLPLTDKK